MRPGKSKSRRSARSNRTASVSRASVLPETLEGRLLFSVPEPNNSFTQAYTPTDNVYLQQNFVANDSVSTAGDTDDYFKFYNLYGKSHLYAALDGMSADGDLRVYDQNQNLLASSTNGGSASETINVDLPANQYFYVRVNAYSGSTNYGLFLYNDYAGSSTSTARDIGVSQGQTSDRYSPYNPTGFRDYLDYRDNSDVWKFQMEAPGTISLRMKDFDYTGNLVARMQLLDASGTVLTDTSGTVGNGLNLDRYTLNSGTYYVRMTQLSGSDPYTFRITSDYAGDRTATARNLYDVTNTSREDIDMVGGPFGLPTYEDSSDLYKFTLSKTSPIDLKVNVDTFNFPSPTFGATLQLAQDSNNDGFIESNEVSSSANENQLLHTTLNPGTYYAVVNQNGAYTSYTLDLDSDLDANPGDPAAYSNLSKATQLGALSGESYQYGGFGISAGDFTDFYKFQMTAPGTLTAQAFLNPVFSRTTNTPSLAVVQDLNNNGHFDAGENVTPFATGTLNAKLGAGSYILEVAGDGQQAAYQLRTVSDYAGNSLGTARAMGPISGPAPATQTFKDYSEQNFGPGSDVDDFYTFTAPQSYQATFKSTGVAGEDLLLQLIKDANNNGAIDAGDVIGASDFLNSPNESITKPLAAGKYFVRVHGVNGGTNYTITASFADPYNTIAKANALPAAVVGGFVDNTIRAANDVNIVRLTVSAGQTVRFDVDSRNASNLDTYLRLFNSAGTQLTANNDGIAPGETASKFSYLSYKFTTAGTYYVAVSLNGNSAYNPVTGLGAVNGLGAIGDYRLLLS